VECGHIAEIDGKSAGGSEGQMKKKKLTSLLRSLSVTAASSSARMATKSSADQSLMVDVQAVHREETAEDEAEVKTNDVNQSQSLSVLRRFNLAHSSPITSVTSSSKYSPMSDD